MLFLIYGSLRFGFMLMNLSSVWDMAIDLLRKG